MLFIMSHEIGHAVLHANVHSTDRNEGQEHEADKTGVQIAVLGYGVERRDIRMAIAGATIAIRVLGALAILGHVFPGHHPSPLLRLSALRRAVRRMCPGEDAYYRLTTIAYSLEETMEAAENIILGNGFTSRLTADRIVSRLWSTLEEHGKGRLSREALQHIFTRDVTEAQPAVRMRAATIIRRISSRPGLAYASASDGGADRRAQLATLNELIAALPPDLCAPFEAPSSLPALET